MAHAPAAWISAGHVRRSASRRRCRGYAAGADPVMRPGTNGLFYYGGLAFNREEGGGSAIFVARFIDNNNQEGIAGEPIDYLGASIVHRIGAPPLVARRQERSEPARHAVAARRSERDAKNAAPAASARRRAARRAQRSSSTSHGSPSTFHARARRRARLVALARASRCRRFRAAASTWPTRSSTVRMKQRGRIMFSRSTDCGDTWSAPRVLSRVPERAT